MRAFDALPPQPCSLPLPSLLGLYSALLTPAPLSPCFHTHSVCGPRRRCRLVFLIQGVLPSPERTEGTQSPGPPRSAATSQSPQPGAFAYSAETQSFPKSILMLLLLFLSPGLPLPLSGCTADRTLPPSPTTYAATPPASAPPPPPPSSSAACCLSCRSPS